MNALLKVTIYVTSLRHVKELREALSRHYGGEFPSSSLVQVAGLFSRNISMKIEAVFAVRLFTATA